MNDSISRPTALYYSVLNYLPENLAVLREQFEVKELPSPADDDPEVLGNIDVCFAPLGYRFGAVKMDLCPRLKAIVTNTTGRSHIDMDAAAARHITVFSLEDEQAFLKTITPTAEHAWGLLLAVLRRTPWCHAAVLEGRWNRFECGAPSMLSRMTLGIIGYGRLGQMVARYGRAFGMPIRFYDPGHDEPAGGAEKVETLEELVSWADVVSLHAPADAHTGKMINRDVFAHFKPGSYFVNTARGELVDEQALVEMLESGRIAGAALDVLNGEFASDFDVTAHPLVRYARDHDNLVLTPHIGGSTIDAWRETQRRVIDMAVASLKGKPE